MAYTNQQIAWTDLLQFSSEGIKVADYPQVKSALAEKFKQIYGRDIDLSTSSADGVYVETLSLMFNNILQAFKSFYSQLNIKNASGTFLDALCALSNVTRKPASASTCNVTITLDESEVATSFNEIKLLDQGGKTWTWASQNAITLQPGVPNTQLVFTCDELGPISAPIGWINATVNATPVINVSQTKSANVGSNAETDTALRARQHSVGNALGLTTLDSIAGGLTNVIGIEDVRIYNNDGSYEATQQHPTGMTANDGTDVVTHGIYIIIRQAPNAAIDDATIGTIIFNKLTTGIRTTETADESADANHSFSWQQYVQQVPTGLFQTVYWKKAIPVHPTIVITITPNDYYAGADNTQAQSIADKVMEYANTLQLSESMSLDEVENIVRYADMRFRNRSTYSLVSVTIDGDDADFKNPDTYFNYNKATFGTSGNNITITLTNE